jgi:hypothetical protein
MTEVRGQGEAGDGVAEDYGTKAAGPSDSARYARGGYCKAGGGGVDGDPAMRRLDKPSRAHFARGGKVGKGKTTVNIVVGQPQQGQPQPVPVPVPVPGPPQPGAMPPLRPPMPMGAAPMMPQGGMPVTPQGMPSGMPPPQMPMRARGGRTMTSGAMSGEGRLEKAANAKGRK